MNKRVRRIIVCFFTFIIIFTAKPSALEAYWLDPESQITDMINILHANLGKEEESTSPSLKQFLQTALLPVGTTMYVWGGGWNEEDTGAGEGATSIGVSQQWVEFYEQQTASYDYKQTRFQINDGLDCSGYVGWAVYNILNTTDGQEGYVYLANEIASNYANRGWGSLKEKSAITDYKPGDILSSSNHVYIAVGECEDGSVVLLHASPQGVQINGTCTPDGDYSSIAVNLADYYMKTYYPDWYELYPPQARGTSYLTAFEQFRWDVSDSSIMIDPDGYSGLLADQILRDLFEGEEEAVLTVEEAIIENPVLASPNASLYWLFSAFTNAVSSN